MAQGDDKGSKDHLAAMVRKSLRQHEHAYPKSHAVMKVSGRVTALPNVHRLISDGLKVAEVELERLRIKAMSEGLNPSESKQFEVYLKAIGTLADAQDRANGTIAGRVIDNMSSDELEAMAQQALLQLKSEK